MADDKVNWAAWAEMDPTIRDFLSAGRTPNRADYIAAKQADMGGKEWTREHENDLPAPFQTGLEMSPEGEGLVEDPNVPSYPEQGTRYERPGLFDPGDFKMERNPSVGNRRSQQDI